MNGGSKKALVWLEKNSKINKRGDIYSALKSKHYFHKLIFKYFVYSISSISSIECK